MTTPHLLIIDDDPDICIFLVEFLKVRMPDTLIDVVASGKGALKRLATSNYTVVLSDLELPDMSGVQLVRYIHATRPHIPTVLMSGAPGFQEKVPAGIVFGCLAKPFDLGRLVHILVRAIEQTRLPSIAGDPQTEDARLYS